jgi:hypothetical protein
MAWSCSWGIRDYYCYPQMLHYLVLTLHLLSVILVSVSITISGGTPMENYTRQDRLEIPAPNYEQYAAAINQLLNPNATVRFQDN